MRRPRFVSLGGATSTSVVGMSSFSSTGSFSTGSGVSGSIGGGGEVPGNALKGKGL